MDTNSLMKKLAAEAYEKGSFNGTWLYAEKGQITHTQHDPGHFDIALALAEYVVKL